MNLGNHLEKGFPVGFANPVHHLIKIFMILLEVKEGSFS